MHICNTQGTYLYTYGLASGLGSFEIVFILRTTLSHAFQTNLWMKYQHHDGKTTIWNRRVVIWYKISYLILIFHIKILRKKLWINTSMNEWNTHVDIAKNKKKIFCFSVLELKKKTKFCSVNFCYLVGSIHHHKR